VTDEPESHLRACSSVIFDSAASLWLVTALVRRGGGLPLSAKTWLSTAQRNVVSMCRDIEDGCSNSRAKDEHSQEEMKRLLAVTAMVSMAMQYSADDRQVLAN